MVAKIEAKQDVGRFGAGRLLADPIHRVPRIAAGSRMGDGPSGLVTYTSVKAPELNRWVRGRPSGVDLAGARAGHRSTSSRGNPPSDRCVNDNPRPGMLLTGGGDRPQRRAVGSEGIRRRFGTHRTVRGSGSRRGLNPRRTLVKFSTLDSQGVEVFRILNATGRSGTKLRPEQVDVGARHHVSR